MIRQATCAIIVAVIAAATPGHAVPPNDDYEDATPIPALPFTASVDTRDATGEPFEAQPSCHGGTFTALPIDRASVWYTYRPEVDQSVALEASGSGYHDPPTIAVYLAPILSGGPLEVACRRDTLAVSLTGGVRYWIQITDRRGVGGRLDFSATLTPGPPTNDDFLDASPIPGLPFTDSVETGTATEEPGEPDPSCGRGRNSVWYSYSAQDDGPVTITTDGSDHATALAVYREAPVAAAEHACRRFGRARVTFHVTSGTTYYVQASGNPGGLLVLSARVALPAPANDDFADASIIPAIPFSASVAAESATDEPGEPEPSCAPGSRSIWYSYTPEDDQFLSFNREELGSHILAVYIGGTLVTLVEEGCEHQEPIPDWGPAEPLELGVSGGTTYHIQLTGYEGWSERLAFTVTEIVEPPNDDFADAATIETIPSTYVLDARLATDEPGEPTPSCANQPKTGSVWYRYTSDSTEPVVIDTRASVYGTAVAVYTGSSLDSLTEVACHDRRPGWPRARVTFHPGSGVTYHIQVTADHEPDQLTLKALRPDPPPNDDFGDAESISGLPYSSNGIDPIDATNEPGEPTPSCGGPELLSLWYSYTPTETETVVFTAAGSHYYVVLAVYTGLELGSLVEAGCANASHEPEPFQGLEIQMDAGTTYYLQVTGANEGTTSDIGWLEIQAEAR